MFTSLYTVYGHLQAAGEKACPWHEHPKAIETQPASAAGLNFEMILQGSDSQSVMPGPAASETQGIVIRNANFEAPPQTHVIRNSRVLTSPPSGVDAHQIRRATSLWSLSVVVSEPSKYRESSSQLMIGKHLLDWLASAFSFPGIKQWHSPVHL